MHPAERVGRPGKLPRDGQPYLPASLLVGCLAPGLSCARRANVDTNDRINAETYTLMKIVPLSRGRDLLRPRQIRSQRTSVTIRL